MFEARAVDPAGEGYRTAFTDWFGCALAGSDERAPAAARLAERGSVGAVIALATAGHVLDFDDTYLPGLAHLSAPTAPVALVLAVEQERLVGEMLAAFAAGFEALGQLTVVSKDALYGSAFHPTAVCGSVGAAVVASRLLGLDPEVERTAVAIALLRSAGLRAAFGSDGKALQVGMAAGAGLVSARLAAAGARVDLDDVWNGPAGYVAAYHASTEVDLPRPAVDDNWIKAWPCCLQTHGAIEAASQVARVPATAQSKFLIRVPTFARAAASFDDVETGLEAKFSIPYLTAFTLLYGPPGVSDLAAVDDGARTFARASVRVVADDGLALSEARLERDGEEVGRVEAARGSPDRPLTEEQLQTKLRGLTGQELDGLLDDPQRPSETLLRRANGHLVSTVFDYLQ